jgi:formylglycine-generating enzyme required for sulfatase activity
VDTGRLLAVADGPGSSLHGRERHPVVHIAFEDAVAYAQWVAKELPTEVEWEYAARAGRPPTTYAWGAQFMPKGKPMANTWHGRFPWENLDPSGIERTSPVGRYPPNDWGLLDLIGNVWEWTTSPWTDNHPGQHNPQIPEHVCCGVSVAELTEQEPSRDERVVRSYAHRRTVCGTVRLLGRAARSKQH